MAQAVDRAFYENKTIRELKQLCVQRNGDWTRFRRRDRKREYVEALLNVNVGNNDVGVANINSMYTRSESV